MLVGGWMALDGRLSIGAYSVIVFITQRLLWPLTRLGQTFDLYQRAMASTARVLDLLDTDIGIVEGDVSIERVSGDIEFLDLGFSYQGREPVYKGLSLKINSGETLGIVGSTGAGKTTLMSLLMRLHDPQSGSVKLDGIDVRDLTLECLRAPLP